VLRRSARVGIRVAQILLALATVTRAAHTQTSRETNSNVPPASRIVRGVVLDAQLHTPIVDATIRIGNNLPTVTSRDGRFAIAVNDTGSQTRALSVRRLGYIPQQISLATSTDRDSIVIHLRALAVELTAVVATAKRDTNRVAMVNAIDGDALRERLGSSVAATIANEPGVAMRYNGPAAAQPVIRGLGGDRVLVLEDGLRTGDLASTAGDHAVTIDPLAIQRIELVRGPAGLLFGGNTIAGVVNVIRGEIPRVRPEHVQQTFSVHGEGVNATRAIGSLTTIPAGPLTLRLVGSLRQSEDTRTPLGKLPYTDVEGHDLGAGMVWSNRRASIGVGARHYVNFYGVPGTFNGRTIPGAHEGGIYVDLYRTTVRVEGELQLQRGPIPVIRADANWNRYYHAEFELGGITGTEFGQLLGTTRVILRHSPVGRLSGTFGMATLYKDLATRGSYTGSRPALQHTYSPFLIEDLDLGRVQLQAGARFDHARLHPLDTISSPLLTGVRDRRFNAFSGSLAARVNLTPSVVVGTSVAQASRIPAIEELYSNGPHLASYRYEIGNPELAVESAVGVDAYLELTRSRVQGRITAFRNAIDDFIDYRPVMDSATGAPRKDYRLRRYDVYSARQVDALLTGIELQASLRATQALSLDLSGSFTKGTRRTDGDAMPSIPPAQLRMTTAYDVGRLFARATGALNGTQNRVPRSPQLICVDTNACPVLPAEFAPTAGYGLLDVSVGTRYSVGSWNQTVTLSVDNVLNRAVYDHLSRAKLVAPQPGRNIKLLLQVTR
jgi:iron complex outermembrane receptor protein